MARIKKQNENDIGGACIAAPYPHDNV